MSDKAPFDWATPLALLVQAFELLQQAPADGPRGEGPTYFHHYVDVATDLEALEVIVDDVRWEIYRQQVPEGTLSFNDWWAAQQHQEVTEHQDRHFCPTSDTWLTYCRKSCTACCEPERPTPCPTIVGPAPR